MQTSEAGRALIVAREGRRLLAYRDSEGILTIGVGHTGRMSPPPVKAGMRITEAECDAMLASDLAPVERVINRAVKVPMTQNEFDAMASLGFNIGAGGLARSSVIRRLNAGDVAAAGQAFMLWCKPAVLTARRAAERKQFLAPDPPNSAGISRSHAVVASRASVLAANAVTTKDKAEAAQMKGVVAAAGGAAVTAIAAQAHAGALAWIIGGVVAGGIALTVVVAWRRHRLAAALEANAAAQADLAASLESPAPQSAQPAQA